MLNDYLLQAAEGAARLSDERKSLLAPLSQYIQSCLEEKRIPHLSFICTHNSRRSHLAQIWAQVIGHRLGLPLRCYSGGTEATAIYSSVLSTLQQAGLSLHEIGPGSNPVYAIRYASDADPIIAFSKTYDHPINPQSPYAAIMTCGHAEENCPYIPNTEARIAVTYVDPKVSDGSPEEAKTYAERSLQIASELYYAISQVQV